MLLAVPECNALGLALVGGPGLGALEDALDGAGRVGLVIVENDLHRHLPPRAAERAFERCAVVVAVDHLATRTTERADVALPAATFADGSGTMVSGEGRAQRFFRALETTSEAVESWRWLSALAARMHGGPPPPETLDEVVAAMVAELPVLAGVEHAAPTAHLRGPAGGRFPRQSARFSGRTAMHADRDVREPRPPADVDSALTFSMEGTRSHPPAALIPLVREPGWNSAQAVNAYQREIAGRLAGGPAGRRLIEPGGGSERPSPEPPPPWRRREGSWLAIPLHHVFGSEELSRLAPGVAELAPTPYVGLAEGDAARLGVGEGDAVRVRLDGAELELPARLGLGLPEGAIGLPVGLDGLPHADLPAQAVIERGRR